MAEKRGLASKFILTGIKGKVVESILNNEETIKWGNKVQEEMRAKFEERRRYALKYLSEHPEIWTTQYK